MLTIEPVKQILIVDRDLAAVEALRQTLTDSGFGVRTIADGVSALTALQDRPPHLVIVDWSMPGVADLANVRKLCSLQDAEVVRIIILSALVGEQDVVAGFEWGADDYIRKPYSLREAVARVTAVLRSSRRAPARRELVSGDLILDLPSGRLTRRGEFVKLRRVEYRLLEFLMSNPDRTFSRKQLLTRIWGRDCDVDERTVDVNVQRLRKLLSDPDGACRLQTVRGFGYRFHVMFNP